MSHSELLVAVENIIIVKMATVPTARNRKIDTSAPMEKEEGDQRFVDLALQAVSKGTGRGNWSLGKGQSWNEEEYQGGNDVNQGGKNFWQKGSDKKGSKRQEKSGKEETRACWTCGKIGHIAAWCRKRSTNILYAIDEDDSENILENTCQRGVCWKKV